MPWKEGAQPLLTPMENFEAAFATVVKKRRVFAPDLFRTWLMRSKKRYELVLYSRPGPGQVAALNAAFDAYEKSKERAPKKPLQLAHEESLGDWCARQAEL